MVLGGLRLLPESSRKVNSKASRRFCRTGVCPVPGVGPLDLSNHQAALSSVHVSSSEQSPRLEQWDGPTLTINRLRQLVPSALDQQILACPCIVGIVVEWDILRNRCP